MHTIPLFSQRDREYSTLQEHLKHLQMYNKQHLEWKYNYTDNICTNCIDGNSNCDTYMYDGANHV